MAVALQPYRFTVEQYHQMGDAGIFPEDCRVELVDGEIFEMPKPGPWHSGTVNRLNHYFVTALAGRAIVHVQNPTELDRYSEPLPDVMLLKPRADFYGTAHPRPEDALLLVEVSDTSLRHDRVRKLPIYARTGVPEYWIVNREADAIEIFRSPSREGYREVFRRGRGESVSPSAFPDLILAVDDLLGERR